MALYIVAFHEWSHKEKVLEVGYCLWGVPEEARLCLEPISGDPGARSH